MPSTFSRCSKLYSKKLLRNKADLSKLSPQVRKTVRVCRSASKYARRQARSTSVQYRTTRNSGTRSSSRRSSRTRSHRSSSKPKRRSSTKKSKRTKQSKIGNAIAKIVSQSTPAPQFARIPRASSRSPTGLGLTGFRAPSQIPTVHEGGMNLDSFRPASQIPNRPATLASFMPPSPIPSGSNRFSSAIGSPEDNGGLINGIRTFFGLAPVPAQANNRQRSI